MSPLDDNSKSIYDLLLGTLSRTNEWLRFAEGKLAALLTFSSACLLACANAIFTRNLVPSSGKWALIGACIALATCAIICLFGLLPRVPLRRSESITTKVSLLSFKDLQHHSGDNILRMIKSHFFDPHAKDDPTQLLAAISQEISDLSKVAARKYQCFNAAVAAILTAPVLAIVCLITSL